jgi:hypothetical protein
MRIFHPPNAEVELFPLVSSWQIACPDVRGNMHSAIHGDAADAGAPVCESLPENLERWPLLLILDTDGMVNGNS